MRSRPTRACARASRRSQTCCGSERPGSSMPEAYLGVDVGSISTKAVVIDDAGEVLASSYLWTEGNPVGAVRRLLTEIEPQAASAGARIVSVGTTGSARELIGAMLGAQTVKNEITAHAMGTLSLH